MFYVLISLLVPIGPTRLSSNIERTLPLVSNTGIIPLWLMSHLNGAFIKPSGHLYDNRELKKGSPRDHLGHPEKGA